MRPRLIPRLAVFASLVLASIATITSGDQPRKAATPTIEPPSPMPIHHEVPDDPPVPRSIILRSRTTSPSRVWARGTYESVQVNVDAWGDNIVGDAANEPSIAVDPTNPTRMAIGWRQFDTITSNFRQAGWAYSHDAGQTWTFPGVLDPGQFRSDPVVDSDADGNFYFYSLSSVYSAEMFKSTDGGVTWTGPVPAQGGDKEWMTIDRTTGIGRGIIYGIWNVQFSCCPPNDFTRSTNGGLLFGPPMAVPPPSMKWGTMDVGPNGELYLAGSTLGGSSHIVAKSTNAQHSDQLPYFDFVDYLNLGGVTTYNGEPNPGGLLGQVWIATDHSSGPSRGNVYILGSVDPPGPDPLDIMFVRSTDGGLTWSEPVRVNDDPTNGAWQWFGTMSVAPNGRIDAVWSDTRNSGVGYFSELFYAFSIDGGTTWSANEPVSPMFNSRVGWPNQNKIGDYYDTVSENFGVSIAYAATFNGEQDVYFLRIGEFDCNGNGVFDSEDIAQGTSYDCNQNDIPDECDPDCNDNDLVDECETRDGLADDCDGNLVPDECQPDFDGDDSIDACDPDIDDDGVLNGADECDYTPAGVPITATGRTLGDFDGSCVVDLGDWPRFIACHPTSGPGFPAPLLCTDWFDYDKPAEHDIDLRDFAAFQRLFGR